MKDKCCGNCKHFCNEDATGQGVCSISPIRQTVTYRHNVCIAHEWKLPKWTEIIPDNVDEIDAIDPNRVVIATMIEGVVYSSMRADSDTTLKACSELGGYYYYVLPELKIE